MPCGTMPELGPWPTGTMPCGTIPCGTMPCGTMPCGTMNPGPETGGQGKSEQLDGGSWYKLG